MIYWIKVREFWVLYRCVLCQSSVFPRIYAPILPINYKKITKYFQCGYKTKTKLKHRTHYAIFQNRRICTSCLTIWLCSLCGLCVLPIYKWLAVCACECGCSGCLCSLGLYGRLVRDSVSVFDGLVFISVDVKYIIHYKRICKFICSL